MPAVPGLRRVALPIVPSHLLAALLCAAFAWCGAHAGATDEWVPFHRYQHQVWSTEAGLPQISVNALAREPGDVLWVGTENGLAQFDGSEFEDRSAEIKALLGTAWITRLMRDRHGRIWAGTIQGVARLDRHGRFGAVPVEGARAIGKVTAIAEDAEGAVCVAGDGLWCLHEDRLVAVASWQEPVSALLGDAEGLWIAGRGVLVRRSAGQEIRRVRLPPALSTARINALALHQGRVWAATSAGLWEISGDEARQMDPGNRDPAVEIRALAEDAHGTLWVSTMDSVYRLVDGRVHEHLDQRALQRFGTVLSMHAEPDGSLWLGSLQNGLRLVWHGGPGRLGTRDGLPDTSVWSYWADARGLLAGTDRGVALLREQRFEPLIAPDALPNPVAYALLRDREQRLWVGTRAGLARFSADGRRAEQRFAELATLQVNSLLEAPDRSVWVATSGGLYRITDTGLQPIGEQSGLDASRIRCLLLDRNGTLWVGTESGLFSGDGKRFARVEEDGPAHTFTTTLLELADGRLLAGTYENGLYIRDTRGWWRLDSADGLPASTAFYLAEHAGALLLSHPNGVYRLALDQLLRDTGRPLRIEVLLADLGRLPNRTRLRCCNGAGNGRGVVHAGHVWLSSLGGAMRIPLGQPPGEVPRVTLRGVAQDEIELPLDERITLRPGSRDLSVRYGAVDFRDAARLRYRYRLSGFDRAWIRADTRRTAWYTNLPAGSYVFEVQARHQYDPWGPAAQFRVLVPPALSERWPFRAALALATLVVLALLLRWREARTRRQQLRLEAVVTQRTQELREANARLAAVNEALAAASVTDPLTGLHNRRFIHEQIGSVVANLRRNRVRSGEDLVIGICVIDIDRFKSVNDDYGHATGDRVLRRIATALRNEMRDGDYLLRWGGEEFVVITNESPRASIPAIMERLRLAAEQPLGSPDEPARVTVSIGYAAYPLPGRELDDHDWLSAMNLADQALYGAKSAGRNCIATVELGATARAELPDHLSAAQLSEWYACGRARLRIGLHGAIE